MKTLLLLVALLLACRPGGAQTPYPAARPDSVAVARLAAPAPDTVAAIHRLFAAKQRKLAFILIGTAAAEVAGQVVVGTTVQGGGIIDSRAIDQFFVAVLAVPVAVAEVLFYTQYNEKHEARAQADFEAHRLPPSLKRRLKPRYFQLKS